jgi:hypothetical protein
MGAVMRCGVALVAVSVALFSSQAAQAQTTDVVSTTPTGDAFSTAGLNAPGERASGPDNEPGRPPSALPAGAEAFTFIPVVTAATYFDDNVFSSHANRMSDWAFLLRPELGFVARGANHAIEGNAYVEGRKYSRFSSEDQINGGASLGSTLMLDPDTQLVGKAAYVHAHEDRGVSESQLGVTLFDKPIAYDQFQAAAALNKRFGRWWTSIGAAGQWVDYQDPTVLGVPVSQNYRDGVISAVTTRFGYVVAPLTSVFIEWSGNHRDFKVDAFDSWGHRVVGGVLLEQGPGARVRGEAYVGYMSQRYTGPSLLPVSTFTYGGLLAWMITPAATLTVGGHRDALESGLVVGGVMGVSLIESVAGARIDYRIAPQWTVGAGLSYVTDEFQGAARTDRYVSPLVSIKYFVTPNVTLGFDYRNLNFDSSGAGVPTYYRNVYMLSVSAKL